MPSRVRASQDVTHASSSRGHPGGAKTALPTYEPPAFPLNADAQRALNQLLNRHSLARLETTLADVLSTLTNNAADINDRVQQRESLLEKRRARKEDSGLLEHTSADFRQKVQRMTGRMDESIRKTIDGQHTIEAVKLAVHEACDYARRSASTQASAPSQAQQAHGNASDDDDSVVPDFTPTDPGNATQAQEPVLQHYRSDVEERRMRYQGHTDTDRYSNNNDYIQFRRLVHDAQHPDDDVPLPHPSEWFDDDQAPAPGLTQAMDIDGDDDDDIAISRAKISTKCPVTLQEFKTAITSKNCPHSYESEVILQMIDRSETNIDGQVSRRGQRSMRCPVGGCNEWISRQFLHIDPVISRKIKRLQRAKQLALEEEHGDGVIDPSVGPQIIDDDGDSDDADDVDALLERHTQTRRAKSEKD